MLSIVVKEKSMKVDLVDKELIHLQDCGFNSCYRCQDFYRYLCKLSLSLKEFYLNCMNGSNQCELISSNILFHPCNFHANSRISLKDIGVP